MTDERHAYLPQPRTTARGRRVDEETRLSLMTPEEREARRLAEEEQLRAYEELRRRQRAIVDEEFANAYRSYTTTSFDASGTPFIERYRIDYDGFFNVPALPPPTLNEQLQAAIQEADRCAQRGDNLGRVNALNTARRLRVALMNQASII